MTTESRVFLTRGNFLTPWVRNSRPVVVRRQTRGYAHNFPPQSSNTHVFHLSSQKVDAEIQSLRKELDTAKETMEILQARVVVSEFLFFFLDIHYDY